MKQLASAYATPVDTPEGSTGEASLADAKRHWDRN
jgi:hypothetical protein